MATDPKLWPRTYYFVSGLLYPGALGAALMWLVQAVNALVAADATGVEMWATAFCLWFTVYHSFLYVRLIDRHDKWCSEPSVHPKDAYGGWGLASDVLDCVALFVALCALGLQGPLAITPERTTIIFLAALGVPASAIVARKGRLGVIRWVLVIGAGLAAGVGACDGLRLMNSRGTASAASLPTHLGIVTLVVLWALLAVYLPALYAPEKEPA